MTNRRNIGIGGGSSEKNATFRPDFLKTPLVTYPLAQVIKQQPETKRLAEFYSYGAVAQWPTLFYAVPLGRDFSL